MAEPLLEVSEPQQAREARQARERELQEIDWRRSVRRMLIQCVFLMFLGVPLYALAWNVVDPVQTRVIATGAFVVSYVAPLLRLLIFHLRATARGDY